MPDDFDLTKEEISRLGDLLKGWSTMSKLDRTTAKNKFISEVLDARQVAQDNKAYLSYYRSKFSSYVSAQNVDQPIRMPQGLKTSWTPYTAFGLVEDNKIRTLRDQLVAQQKEAPGATEEEIDKKIIGAFNTAHSQLFNALSEDERLAYKNIADAWIAQGPEEEDRLKIAIGRLPGWGKGIVDSAWKQAGAVSMFIYCYKDAQGSIQVGRFDTSQLPGMKGQKFTDAQPQWEQSTVKCLARFAENWLTPGEYAETTEAKSSAAYEFAQYDDGIPILPQEKDGKVITNWKEMREILRPWFNQNYALACGVPNSLVPWTKVIAKPSEFFPEGLFDDTLLSSLKQPGQMDKATVTGVWGVIQGIQCQGDGSRFRFKSVIAGKKIVPASYTPSAPKPSGKGGKKKGTTATNVRLPPVFAEAPIGHLPPGVQGPRLPPAPPRKRKQRSKRKGKGKAKALSDDSEEASSSSDSDSADDVPHLSDGSGSTLDDNNVQPGMASPAGFPQTRSLPAVPRAATPGPSNTQSRPPAPRAVVKSTAELISATANMVIPPSQAAIDEAKNQPPCWVDRDERVFPYLWTLGPMPEYRTLLASWRHVMLRREKLDPEIPMHWGSWKTNDVSCPAFVHLDEPGWMGVLYWIRHHCPEQKKNCTPVDVQTWFLITGMAMRDILITMEIEPDCPVVGGAEYLHNSPADVAHIHEIIEPIAAGAYHPLPPQGHPSKSSPGQGTNSSRSGSSMPGVPQADVPHGRSVSVKPGNSGSVKPAVKLIKGRKGNPPGVRASDAKVLSLPLAVDENSKDLGGELADIVMDDESGTGLQSRDQAGPSKKATPYVLVPTLADVRAAARSTTPAGQSQGRPETQGDKHSAHDAQEPAYHVPDQGTANARDVDVPMEIAGDESNDSEEEVQAVAQALAEPVQPRRSTRARRPKVRG